MTFSRTAAGLAACPLLLSALPARALDAGHVAIIVNTADPLSMQIAEYYAARRHINFQNIIKVSFPADRTILTQEEFSAIKAKVDKAARPQVQAFALTWAVPYRVDCMSITSAFAFGFDPAYCADGCKPTRLSPYFDSRARRPFAQLGIRPAMALAATSLEQAKALIDRGVQSDGTMPEGTAYLLSTSDAARNVRSVFYPAVKKNLVGRVRVSVQKRDSLKYGNDVLFYFTGRYKVDGLQNLRFVPGAIADHLTSSGGVLTAAEESGQMSALRWLEAGATGSYGTVIEPCNLTSKFPNPAVVASRYVEGETLIEAYWKSVAMPGQGIFIGEPLAAPFRRSTVNQSATH